MDRDIPYMIVASILRHRASGLDRFLLHEEEDHVLQFPGGKVKTGESLVEALKREMMEEVGFTLENEPVLVAIEHVSTTRESSSTPIESKLIFFFEIAGGATSIDHATWVSKVDLPSFQHRIPYDNCLLIGEYPCIRVGEPCIVPPGFVDSPTARDETRTRTFLWKRDDGM